MKLLDKNISTSSLNFARGRMKRVAVVVGVNAYKNPFNPLFHAVEDARLVAGFLEQRLGFKTIFLDNPLASDVESVLDFIVRDSSDATERFQLPNRTEILASDFRLDDDSVFVFYFAGHGMCLGGAPNQSLLCSEANGFLARGRAGASGAISPDVLADLSRSGRGDMFFCYDVCRTTGRGESAPQEGGAGLRDATAFPKDDEGRSVVVHGARLTLSSCADGDQANDDGNFATALVREMTLLVDKGLDVRIDQPFVERVASKLEDGQRPELAGTPLILAPGKSAPVKTSSRSETEAGKVVVTLDDFKLKNWAIRVEWGLSVLIWGSLLILLFSMNSILSGRSFSPLWGVLSILILFVAPHLGVGVVFATGCLLSTDKRSQKNAETDGFLKRMGKASATSVVVVFFLWLIILGSIFS